MIPPVLAQMPTATDAQLLGVLIGGGAVLALVALWKMVFPKREPAIEAEFATKSEMTGLRIEINERLSGVSNKIERLRLELREEEKTIQSAAQERVQGLHLRIDELRGDITDTREAWTADAKHILEKIGELRGKVHS